MKLLSCAVLALVLGVGANASAEEARGVITGRISDIANNVLPGATVHIEPHSVTVVTDREGAFTVSNLAPGDYVVEINYVGFQPEKKTVKLSSGGRADVVTELRPRLFDEVTVTASRPSGEVKALNQQKTADNILNVLPAEIIKSLPNNNVADAIGRLPSVSLERDEGEGKYVQIRGTDPRLSNVTINGAHIPSPEGSVRNIKLDVISSELVGAIELSKTLSADQDGDAIGGSVNLVTKTAGDHPYFNVSGQGGYVDLLGGRAMTQWSGTYSSRFGPDKQLGLIIGGSYDWDGRGINDIEPAPGLVDFGGTAVPVVTAMDVREYRYQRNRYGAAGGLDYRLGPGSELYLRGLFADFQNYGDRWLNSPSAGDFITPTTTADNGATEKQVQTRRPDEMIASLSAGGKHDLGGPVLDYNLAYSRSRQNQLNAPDITFAGPSDVAWGIDLSDPYTPRFSVLNGVDINNPKLYVLDAYRIRQDRTSDHEVAGAINLRVPYQTSSGAGTFKLGAKVRSDSKKRVNADRFFNATGSPELTLDQALESFNDPDYYFGKYPLGPLPSLDATARFVASNPGALTENFGREHTANDPLNFNASEKVYAAYAMDTTEIGRVHAQAGVRVERTSGSYTGNKIVTDSAGRYASTVPASGDHAYTSVLPNLQLRFEIDPETNLRAVYGQGISRPNFGDLVPFIVENDRRGTVSAGNPALKPTRSHNYDVLFEHYLKSIGFVSAGFFYKDLRDPIYPSVQTVLATGPFAGFTQSQAINGPKAHLQGVEFAWQEHLGFLPGFLAGFGILANYTYTDSRATVPGRSDNPRLLRTTPNEFNVGLSYDRGPFSARAAVTYNDANVFAYNYVNGAEGGPKGPNGDLYLYPHTQIDAQASYTFKLGIQVFANVLNLNNEVFGFYQGSPQYMLQREFYGWTTAVGLRYTR